MSSIVALAQQYPDGGRFLFPSALMAAQAGLVLQALGYNVNILPTPRGYLVRYLPKEN